MVKSNLETFGSLFLRIVKSIVKMVDFLSNEVVIYAIYKFHISSQFLFVGDSAENINGFDGDISIIEFSNAHQLKISVGFSFARS